MLFYPSEPFYSLGQKDSGTTQARHGPHLSKVSNTNAYLYAPQMLIIKLFETLTIAFSSGFEGLFLIVLECNVEFSLNS